MARYRKLIGLISASSKVIDEAGGLRSYIEQNEVEGTRILLAAKNQKKNEQGRSDEAGDGIEGHHFAPVLGFEGNVKRAKGENGGEEQS